MGLGTGAMKGHWGSHLNMRHSREVSMATLWSGKGNSHPLKGAQREEGLWTGEIGTSKPPNQTKELQTRMEEETHLPKSPVATLPTAWKNLTRETRNPQAYDT